ncbi:hypothetical protein WR25_21352 [Diploscapter pachys]|uniref:Golgin subfamily A conserved domain-containing protein n=1 Tax=Diploscapter pachys TaxID=2018661 RepID=A0A2A2KQW9_9BILA|nr:hypothetical protein WR25_21352 [Diploscapter pachys]
MSDPDRVKAEKIALAKKKLKEFEMKRQRESPVPSSEHTGGRQSTVSFNSESGYQLNGSDQPVNEQPHSHEHSTSSNRSNSNGPGGHEHVQQQAYSNMNYHDPVYQQQYQQPYNTQAADDSAHSAHEHAHDGHGHSHEHQPQQGHSHQDEHDDHFHSGTNGAPQHHHAHAEPVQEFAPVPAPFQSHMEELTTLKTERDELAAAHEQMKGQMEQLLSHYTQLHTAYTQISSNGVHSDVEKQILQLQSAVAVLVEEKTALQSELRSTKENLEKEIRDKGCQQSESTVSSGEVSKLTAKVGELSRILDKRMEELDCVRREAAHMQTQLRTLNNEKSDAQARLKAVFREKETVDTQLAALKKELHMKDIYLKQLGAHNVVNAVPVDQDHLQQMNARLEELTKEVSDLKTARDQAVEEMQTVRQHYEAVNRELADKYKATAEELDSIQAMRWAGEAKIRELEDRLVIMTDTLSSKEHQAIKSLEQNGDVTGSVQIANANLMAGVAEEEVNQKVREAVRKTVKEWEQILEEEMKKADQAIQEKDRVLFEKEQALAETQMRYRLLEERTLETQANGADLLSLSEQLQNEKATVSRALAQNREVKEQLIEIQNRIVTLTEEKLASELARQTAEHQVKTLMQKMNLQDAGLISNNEPIPGVESVRQDNGMQREEERSENKDDDMRDKRGDSVSSSKSVDSNQSAGTEDMIEHSKAQITKLQRQLEDADRVMSQLRDELRRSNAQNEEMQQIMRQNAEDENQNSILVELTQAIERINALSNENHQLRENLNRAVTALHNLESTKSGASNANSQQAVFPGSSISKTVAPVTTPTHTAYSETETSSATDRTPSQITVMSDEAVQHKNEKSSSEEGNVPMPKQYHLSEGSSSQYTTSENTEMIARNDNVTRVTRPELAAVSEKVVKKSDAVAQQPIGSREWAFQSLETRFNEVMAKYADQQEHMEQLEHINTQLQLENDTIADHVVLYQHQRRLIRERLRAKDQQLNSMEREREKTIQRCKELQDALMLVLGQNGMLKEYQTGSLTKGKRRSAGKRRGSRSYSQSTVDELSGDEHVIVDAKNQIVPPRETFDANRANSFSPPPVFTENGIGEKSPVNSEISSGSPIVHEQSRPRADSSASVKSEDELTSILRQTTNSASPVGNQRRAMSPSSAIRSQSPSAQTAAVKKILEILSDISATPSQSSAANNLHCTQCIGNLETI